MRMNRFSPVSVLFVAVLALVAGCASIGLQTAGSFKERVAYAYGVHTAIQESAASSLTAHEISSDDAKHVLAVADESRLILDGARTAFSAGDTSSAEGKLVLATSVLTQLQVYLRNKGGG